MKDLKKENEILRQKLENAQKWMQKEVLNDFKNINKNKQNFITKNEKNIFLNENIEEIIENKIINLISEENFIFISENIFQNIVSSETLYLTIINNKNLDGLGIITSYQKVFDEIIEKEVSKLFRKYFNSLKIKPNLVNDLIEKRLYSVIFEGHILGFGRLFSLLKSISLEKNLGNYSKIFKDFLEKYSYIKNILLDKDFLENYKKIANLEVFGSKRHLGKVNFEDILQTRKYFLGNLEEKNCLFYKLILLYN